MSIIGIPPQEEYDFVSYFDKNIDPNDMFNHSMDYDYLRDSGILGHLAFLHMIISEKQSFYWIFAMNNVWGKYCQFRNNIDKYEKIKDKTMPEIKQQPLSENEINFCKYWEEVVMKRPDKIHSYMLDKAGGFIGVKRSGNCAQCLRNDAIELNNRYQRLFPKYKEYKSWLKNKELIEKQTIASIKEETKKIEEIREKKEELKEKIEKTTPRKTTKRIYKRRKKKD